MKQNRPFRGGFVLCCGLKLEVERWNVPCAEKQLIHGPSLMGLLPTFFSRESLGRSMGVVRVKLSLVWHVWRTGTDS